MTFARGDTMNFDRTSPDPSRRHCVRIDASFSQRCGLNGIESGMRTLAGTPLHPREFVDSKTLLSIWVLQETGEVLG